MAVQYSVVGVKNDVESFNGETMIYSVAARFRLSCLQEYKMSRSTNDRKERKCAYFAHFFSATYKGVTFLKDQVAVFIRNEVTE